MAKLNKVRLGQMAEGPGSVTLDVMRLVDSRMLLQANSGGGKSWALRRLAELVAASVPTIFLDPEGEFSTLRERLDILLVGPEGELETDPRSAGLLARKLLELRLSAVVDLYPLKLPQRRAFVRRFCEELLTVRRTLWQPLIVILDEAHRFCPERSAGESEATEAIINLASQGRKRGYCLVLATQRLSKLHKDAAAEANNWMIGRTALDVDQKRAADALGIPSSQRLALRDLQPGDFHAFGPAFTFTGVRRVRVDKVETTHPRPGHRRDLKSPRPSRSIKRVLPEFENLGTKSEHEARDLTEAKQEIRKLKRESRMAERQPSRTEIDRAVRTAQQVHEQEVRRARQAHVQEVRDINHRLSEAATLLRQLQQGIAKRDKQLRDVLHAQPPQLPLIDKLAALLSSTPMAATVAAPSAASVPSSSDTAESLAASVPSMPPTAKLSSTDVATPPSSPLSPSASSSTLPSLSQDGEVQLNRADRLILAALVQHPDGLEKVALAIITGYRHTGGGFNNALGKLRSCEFVERGYPIRVLPAGSEAVGSVDPLPAGRDLLDFWLQRKGTIGKCDREVLTVLADCWPDTLTKEEVAERTPAEYSPVGGGFNNSLGRLRSLGLITGKGDALKASNRFFD